MISNGYASLDQLKQELRLSGATDDPRLERKIEAVSRSIEDWCGRRFWKDPAPVARQYAANREHLVVVDDMAEVPSEIRTDVDGDGVFEVVWSPADWVAEPVNAIADGRPLTALYAVGSRRFPMHAARPGVQVSCRFGWPVENLRVREACLLQSVRLFKRADSPEGVVSGGPEFGGLRISSLDPDVRELLRGLHRPKVA